MWGWNSADVLVQDLRYGLRQFRRNPGFTLVAVLTLAIGIAVNTAVFTAYKAMIARPLEARNAQEMVNLALIPQSGSANFSFSYPDYETYRDSVHSFNGLIAFRMEQMTLSNTGGIIGQRGDAGSSLMGRLGLLPAAPTNVEFSNNEVVSENYFNVLGISAIRGRTFDSLTAAELRTAPSVLISENYWQRRFARDSGVLGKSVRLNGVAVQILGITRHDFVGTGVAVPDFWVPLSLEPLLHADPDWLRQRENQCCRLFARLIAGTTIHQAQADVNIVADHVRTLHDAHSDLAKPATAIVWQGSPFPLPLSYYHGLKVTISLVMLAGGMLLLVACANVGSLQLARARSRQHELHTRLSLGASRLRVIRQLLTESTLLAVFAGSAALLFSWAFLQVLVVLLAGALPAEDGALVFHVNPDLGVFGYVFVISLAAGILFGLAPALESSRAAISSGARASTSSAGTRRLQNLLIIAQVSLSLVLMIAGSMLIRSSMRSLNMETGYDDKRVINLDFQFPDSAKYSAERKLAVIRELRNRLAAVPGVAAITSGKAPDDFGFRTAALPVNKANGAAENAQQILHYTYVQPNYFNVVGIPLLLGRGFQSQVKPETAVILSESAARQLWPGKNPVGRSLRLGPTDDKAHNMSELVADSAAYQVVGIVSDTRGIEFDGSDSKRIYLPMPDDQLQSHPMLIKTQTDPARVIKAIDPAISAADPNLIASSSTLSEMLGRSASFLAATIAAAIASSVGLLGLLLALMGIYGTVSYIVALRTREVGIRMAVGAEKRDILSLILRESTRPVLVGLFVGMVGAVGASYLLRGVLYGVSAVDGISFIGVSSLFLVMALLAAYPPSRRAMRVDPVVALRYE